MIWRENQPPIIIVIYITETTFSLSERNAVIAGIGEIVFRLLGDEALTIQPDRIKDS